MAVPSDQTRAPGATWLRITLQVLGITAGALAVALSARVTTMVPGSDVPQTLQTLVVLLVGVLLEPWKGALTLVAYVLAGALGAPVFADGASGLSTVTGPTAGYLMGFVVAAWGVGWATARGWAGPGRGLFGPTLLVMASGHALILVLGGSWLARFLGVAGAVQAGVSPFLPGAAVKSALAAVIVTLIGRPTGRPAARRAPP